MEFSIATQGRYDFINITEMLNQKVKSSKVESGIALVSALHATVAITIMEWEDGIKKDIKEVLEKLAPENKVYEHHKRWGDHNGAAHIKSALMGPSLSLSVENGELKLGQWQQVALIDFDEKPRERRIDVKVLAAN